MAEKLLLKNALKRRKRRRNNDKKEYIKAPVSLLKEARAFSKKNGKAKTSSHLWASLTSEIADGFASVVQTDEDATFRESKKSICKKGNSKAKQNLKKEA